MMFDVSKSFFESSMTLISMYFSSYMFKENVSVSLDGRLSSSVFERFLNFSSAGISLFALSKGMAMGLSFYILLISSSKSYKSSSSSLITSCTTL